MISKETYDNQEKKTLRLNVLKSYLYLHVYAICNAGLYLSIKVMRANKANKMDLRLIDVLKIEILIFTICRVLVLLTLETPVMSEMPKNLQSFHLMADLYIFIIVLPA